VPDRPLSGISTSPSWAQRPEPVAHSGLTPQRLLPEFVFDQPVGWQTARVP